MEPSIFLAAFSLVCSVPVVITAMILVSRHLSQRRQSLSALQVEEIMRRLERIEQAVDTSAIEVERLSESHRFVAKLLSEGSAVPRSG